MINQIKKVGISLSSYVHKSKKEMATFATIGLMSASMLLVGFVGNSQTVERETITQEIPIKTIRQEDANIPKGVEELAQSGSVGKRVIIQEKTSKDGQVIETKEIKVISEEPMNPRIVKVGTKDNMVSTEQGHKTYSRKVVMEASAYLSTDGGGHGITATGVMATRGIVAVDPNVIPLGSKVFIPGYGVALAADTGGYIIGNRIDLVMDTYSEAMNFGRRDIDVYILD